ncbi:hypothetical protein F66182_6851 [Fusarium sp. NRRL 66182]|nr:hypothetical protein F66182_6851 [Fusarium sp. NRRL 66182]
MTAPTDPALFSTANESLAPLIPILNGFAHRHKNQHSSTHWWSSFSILRRAARNLAHDLAARPPAPKKNKSGNFRRDTHPALTRAKWMSRHVVPRAFVAFSQLAADNQHAPLGLLLLSVLARVHALLSHLVPADFDHRAGHSTVTKPASSGADIPAPLLPTGAQNPSSEMDMGVAISRDELDSSHKTTTRPGPSSSMCLKEPATKERKPNVSKANAHKGSLKDDAKDRPRKKKKKGDDALSTLFGAL